MKRHTSLKRYLPHLRLLITVYLLQLLLLGPAPLHAAQENPPEEPPQNNPDQPLPTTEEDTTGFLDKSYGFIGTTFETLEHERVSRSIEDLSLYLDSFLGAPDYYEETTKSYAALRLRSIYARGGETDFDARFKLRIDLPRTEHRLKLRLEFEEDDTEFDDPIDESDLGSTLETQDTTLNASLQYVIRESRHWVISLSPGAKLHNPIDGFVKLRLRRNKEFTDWTIRFLQSFEWYHSTSYGTKTNLYFDRQLGEKTLLRFVSQAYRNEEEYAHGNFEVSQRISLYHALKKHVVIGTEAAIIGENKPVWRHRGYYWNVQFRRDIHKGFVFLSIQPQVDFRHENNFHAEESISLSLEVLYGGRYINP